MNRPLEPYVVLTVAVFNYVYILPGLFETSGVVAEINFKTPVMRKIQITL